MYKKKGDRLAMGNYRSILIGDHCAMVLTGIIQCLTESQTIPYLLTVQCCAGRNCGTALATCKKTAMRMFTLATHAPAPDQERLSSSVLSNSPKSISINILEL